MATIKKTVKITLFGGYHNSEPINVNISADAYADLLRGSSQLYEVLSGSQLCKLARHFCGIKGCMCGGIAHAKWGIASK